MTHAPEHRIDAYLLAGPDAVCVCIPYLVGYSPVGSIVVIWLDDGIVALTMRIDAPGAGDDLDAWLADCTRCEVTADEVIICAFGERGEQDDLPWVAPVSLLADAFAARELAIRDALLCDGRHWWSYLCQVPECCPPAGRPIDESTRLGVAAHFTYAGMSVLPDREALAEAMAPQEDPAVVAELLRLQVELPRRITSTAALEEWRDEATAMVLEHLGSAPVITRGGESLPPADAAAMLAALLDVRVRDVVLWELARWEDPRDACEAAVSLMRRAPGGFRAPSATMAALLAWLTGDGVRAAIAVRLALDEDPEYSMAVLLARSLRAGMSPAAFRELLGGMTREECRGMSS